MSDVLDGITAQTRADLSIRKASTPIESLMERAQPSERSFRDALGQAGLSLIAEFKPRSPSKGALRPDASPEDIAGIYETRARAMSVLCDAPFFGGGYPTLARVRAVSNLPLLAKDFVVDPYQLYEARVHGADAVLLMASVLDAASIERLLQLAHSLALDALVEVHDAAELATAVAVEAKIIGVNSRNLKTLEIDLEHACRLLAEVPDDRIRVAESGLDSRTAVEQVEPLADAVLIGSHFMGALDVAAAVDAIAPRGSPWK